MTTILFHNARLIDPEGGDRPGSLIVQNGTILRVLGPNLPWMVHRHVAYVGEQDPWFIDNAGALEAQAWALGKPFERVIVPGDHMESLGPALAAFRALALSSSY